MAQLKTYSRKSKLADPFDGAYKSSQESFFDSPDDPYSFDSQHSALDCSVPSTSTSTQSTLLRSSSVPLSGAAYSNHSQSQQLPLATSAVQNSTATPPVVQARAASLLTQPAAAALQSQQQCSKPLSRLSQSSSQPAGAKPASALPAKQKRGLTIPLEGPAPKKACLRRPSSSSVSKARSSGSRSGKDKDKQHSAPATTVLEVNSLHSSAMSCSNVSMLAEMRFVTQAQESGEHTQIVDDIVYAVDGLGRTSSKNSWQDSASTLAEICNTRRGRQAFRCVHNSTMSHMTCASVCTAVLLSDLLVTMPKGPRTSTLVPSCTQQLFLLSL